MNPKGLSCGTKPVRLLNSHPNNRRVEIYIKGADGEDAINPPGTGMGTAPVEETAAPVAASETKPAERSVEAPKIPQNK